MLTAAPTLAFTTQSPTAARLAQKQLLAFPLVALLFLCACDYSPTPSLPKPPLPKPKTATTSKNASISNTFRDPSEAKKAPANPAELLPADKIKILFWNIESGGADPTVIARQLKEIGKYDIYAFCEVKRDEYETLKNSLGDSFSTHIGRSGHDDRLVLSFDKSKFQLLARKELGKHKTWTLNPGNYRSPLVLHLKHHSSGQSFKVMTNHLARGKAKIRQSQATGLRHWAADQSDPVIAIGDFNFDFVFETRKGNPAFDLFLKDGTWKWIEPKPLIDSNWYDREGDGNDDYPGSILDFAFTCGPAKQWTAVSNVIVRDGDFPDDDSTSDHRPLEMILSVPKKQ